MLESSAFGSIFAVKVNGKNNDENLHGQSANEVDDGEQSNSQQLR